MLETTPTEDGVEEMVTSTIAAVMAARDLDPGGIEPLARLSETLGLRSLDLAQIVLTLEDDLNIDPFQTIPITSIRTVGDLTDAYPGVARALGPRLAGCSGHGRRDGSGESAPGAPAAIGWGLSNFEPNGLIWRLGNCGNKGVEQFRAKWVHLATRKLRKTKESSVRPDSIRAGRVLSGGAP